MVDNTEHRSDPTSNASDPRHRGRPSCLSPPEEVIGNTREGGEPAEALTGMCRYHRVISADTHENSDCKDTALTNVVPIDIPKEPITGFGSLKDILGDIPAAYTNHEVRL